MAELEQEAYAEMALLEKYVPSKNDKAGGKWAIICEKLLEDGEPDLSSTRHVMPTYGTQHYISDRCWCGPKINEDGTVVHEASQ